MTDFELVMPKMGESIMEATILKWLKKEGDPVEEDETILEIATDKVDSEIPSPIEGVIKQLLFQEEDIVSVGETIALITANVDSEIEPVTPPSNGRSSLKPIIQEEVLKITAKPEEPSLFKRRQKLPPVFEGRFYSPLVRSIAQKEGMTMEDLKSVSGTGMQGRVTKKDLLLHLSGEPLSHPIHPSEPQIEESTPDGSRETAAQEASFNGDDEIIEMGRMRRIIAEHMVMSKQIAPHVTSFVEADMTDIVHWRAQEKKSFFKHNGSKLTFTPIFIYAVAKAIRDFPMINASVQDNKIILKKQINIGMATALPSGNLIVPVIKDADSYSVTGLARKVNDLADRARDEELKPDDIQGGTFTLTNVGSFGNLMGTPIINQPQVAILATGAIRKKPAVVETEYGDLIAIRHMVFLSLSYDHRVVDGLLGGSFLRRVADYLERFKHDQNF